MSRRGVLYSAILLLLALNTAAGVTRVMASWHQFRGERELAEGSLNEALSDFMAASRWQPSDASTYVMIGRVIYHAQANSLRLEAYAADDSLKVSGVGVAAIARAIALNPADAWGWFNLGNLYRGLRSARVRFETMMKAGRELGAHGAAGASGEEEPVRAGLDPEEWITVAATLKAAELEPEFHFYHDFLAKMYWESGLKEDAAREISEAFALAPRLPAHELFQDKEAMRGLAEAALEGVERSASSRFSSPAMRVRARAEINEGLGRIPEAIAAYEELRAVGGRLVEDECDLSLAKLKQQQKRYEESIPLLQRVAGAGPQNRLGAWALYYLGVASSRLNDHRRAAEYFRRHLEARPDDSPSGYLSLSEEMEVLGDSEEALKLRIAAVRRFPEDPRPYHWVIQHMRKHGMAERALSYAEALRKVDPGVATEALVRQVEAEATRAPSSR